SGYGLTRVQPFHQGRPLPYSGKTLEFAGQDLSAYLLKSLFKEDCDRRSVFQLETVAVTQMSKCYVPQTLGEALDFRESQQSGLNKSNTYQLPDGSRVELTPMQHVAPEMFFSPQMFKQPGNSIPQAILESVESCEISLRPLLASHVMVCGGNTLYPGFATRLFRELMWDHFSSVRATVWAGSNRNFSVWLGASVVAHLSTYQSEWMSREEYGERMRV
ncbi:actin-like protein 8, partial [Saimiri boliviensis]|uniref:actin-like protein 8 n=1 Tax=Saimiri boliviensis TaxID=27679 RepID=UPI000533FE8F